MEKRLLFVFVVTTLLAIGWMTVLHIQSGEEQAALAGEPPAVAEATAQTREGGEPAAVEAPRGASGEGAPRPESPPAQGPEQLAELSNPKYFTGELSTLGGTFRRFLLLDRQYEQEARDVLPGVPPEKAAAGPLDLISTWSPEFYPYQIAWTRFEGAAGAEALLAEWRQGPRFALVERTDQSLTYVWPDPRTTRSDIYVERHYAVSGAYTVDFRLTVHNLGPTDLTTQLVLEIFGWQDPSADPGGMFTPAPDLKAGSCMAGDEVVREPFHSLLEKARTVAGTVQWAAVDTRYFLVAALPRDLRHSQCALSALPLGVVAARIHQTQPFVVSGTQRPCLPDWAPAREGAPRCSELHALLGVPEGATARQLADAVADRVREKPEQEERLRDALEVLRARGGVRYDFALYIGPKDIDHLAQAGPALTEALDFGVLSFLAVPMLHVLRFAHGLVPSWALAIVLLTVLVKVLLLPLTHKSFKQMQKMQKLKPEMDKIRQQFGSDKQKMNQEMLQLYKSHKVNPLGGCLPMLLQMPVYIALYQTIYHSVELYQAPLFGWVRDLSAPDPYYVLPLVLGATMFLQQKLTPMSMDSSQARIMLYVMPVMFTAFMLVLPSGLVLYIFVNTILTMVQQMALQRRTA